MNILHILKNKAGKLALSTMQTAGIAAAAVVGVAGLAALQVGGSDDVNPNTAFSSSADSEVVFVASGAPGGYGGVNVGAGGEVRSGMNVSMSRSMQLMQEDEIRSKEAEQNKPEFEKQEDNLTAFKMDGAAEGLGMGANAVADIGNIPGMGDMKAVQDQMAAIQAATAAKQQEVAAALSAEGGDANAAALAAMGQQLGGGNTGSKWGMAQGMARAGGNNLNSAPLQAGNMTPQKSEEYRAAKEKIDSLTAPKRLSSEHKTPKFTSDREAAIYKGKNLGDGHDTLVMLSKQSSDVAGNKNRSANTHAQIFLAAEKQAGGLQLVGGEQINVTASSSSDFGGNIDNALGAIAAQNAAVIEEIDEFEQDRKSLRTHLGIFVTLATVVIAMSWMIKTLFLAVAWMALYAAFMGDFIALMIHASKFQKKWSESGLVDDREGNGLHNKVYTVATAAVVTANLGWVSMLAATISFAAVMPALLLSNFDSTSIMPEEPTEQQQQEYKVPSSPYGPNTADDALHMGSSDKK